MQGLAAELSTEDGCENAIFPDSVILQDRCMMPGGMVHEGVSGQPRIHTSCRFSLFTLYFTSAYPNLSIDGIRLDPFLLARMCAVGISSSF